MPIIEAPGAGKSDGEVFKLLPTDSYPVRIDGVDLRTSNGEKTQGQPMLELTLVVRQESEFAGAKLWHYQMCPCDGLDERVHQQRVDGIAMIQIACGVDRNDKLDTDDIKHAECIADVKEVPKKEGGKVVKGEFTNSIKKLRPEM